MKSELVVVTKRGCPACEHTKPVLKKLQKQLPHREIDADARPDVVQALGTKAFPDIAYIAKDGVVHRMPWNGVPDVPKIVRWAAGVKSAAKQPRKTKQPSQQPCARCGPGGAEGGASPAVWGPPVWFAIHMLALMYPREPSKKERVGIKQFFVGLQKVLPCDDCRRHFAEELARMDQTVFDSRDSLFAWTVAFHDKVSARTHSTQPRHSLAYWRRYYKNAADLKNTGNKVNKNT